MSTATTDGRGEWAHKLLRTLFEHRPRYCDVAIQCSDGQCVNAHRAVLAAGSRYFKEIFTRHKRPPPESSDGPTEDMRCETVTVPTAWATGNVRVSFNAENNIGGRSMRTANIEAVGGPPNEAVVKLGRLFFKGSSKGLEKLVEYLYLGEIRVLEECTPHDAEGCLDGGVATSEDPALTGDDSENIWIWLLTWSFKHDNVQLFEYTMKHLLRVRLPIRVAGHILDLLMATQLNSTGAADHSKLLAKYLRMLRSHAFKTFEGMKEIEADAFTPLSRAALEQLLQEASLQAPEVEVMRAVDRWAKVSSWAITTYGEAGLPEGEPLLLARWLEPRCLTPQEFSEFEHLFPQDVQTKLWRAYATTRLQRIAPSPVFNRRAAAETRRRKWQLARSINNLQPPLQAATHMRRVSTANGNIPQALSSDLATPNGRKHSRYPSDSAASHERPDVDRAADGAGPSAAPQASAAPNPASQNGAAVQKEDSLALGSDVGDDFRLADEQLVNDQQMSSFGENYWDDPPNTSAVENTRLVTPAELESSMSYGQALLYVDNQARVDPGDPASAFAVGRGLSIVAEADKPNRFLVTVNSPSYQAFFYRGFVPSGVLRWRLEVVRPCDMFWMGVTSRTDLDLGRWTAGNEGVYMISEEGTCVQSCHDNAVLMGPSEMQRINLSWINCFHCIEEDDPWAVVEMELNTASGDLFIDVNSSGREHVFKNLPKDQPLCPCVCAVNTAQAVFELLEARPA